MNVLSYRTAGWAKATEEKSDHAGDEIHRVLSDVLRSENLIVLTGLGTSLHINVNPVSSATEGRRTAHAGRTLAPTMWDLWLAAERESGTNFQKVLKLAKLPSTEIERGNIEALLSYCKAAAQFIDQSPDKEVIAEFVQTTERIIRDKVRFLGLTDDVSVHADFLRRIARRSSRKLRTKIFTTNYDLCFEQAARDGRYVVVDGFSHTTPQVFDSIYFSYDIVKRDNSTDGHDFISNVFHLYKMHGSIDWKKNPETKEIEKDPTTDSPVLIYPRNTKYELAFEQPYLEMMAAFQAAIRQPDTGLIILGFGFNDNHIAEPILSAIRSNLSLKVVICDPALGEKDAKTEEPVRPGTDVTNPYLSKIRYLIQNGDARLALISGTFQEVVPAIPDIAAQSDLEQHLDRVRNLRSHQNA
jgi:hypothetical protein